MAFSRICVTALSLSGVARAVTLDTASPDSIRSATRSIVQDMMDYYVGDQPGQTPGFLPGSGQEGGYYWWVGGGMFNTMINYWYHTGDDTWNDQTAQAIWWQSDPGSGGFFASPNITNQLGNDDQAFWAMAAMSAAEYKFPNPPDSYPSWLAMAQGVFNQQLQRWDDRTCGGGLRWQVNTLNPGYNYKNAISNGCFMNLAARLAKYTGNTTYAEWATKTWDWSVNLKIIEPEVRYKVIDGIDATTCDTSPDSNDLVQWTYNVGVYLLGAAAMWNYVSSLTSTNDQTASNPALASEAEAWRQRTEGMVDGASIFLREGSSFGNTLTEQVCEPANICKVDQTTFKAYLARWLFATAEMAPYTAPSVFSMLAPSAAAAAQVCSQPGRAGGIACGQQWYTDQFDGRIGIGQQMNALEVMINLIPMPGPVDIAQGISTSDPNAGTEDGRPSIPDGILKISQADRAGAIILTIVLCVLTLGMGVWTVL